MEFNTLYKKTSTGAIQSWQVKVEENTYHTISGQITGKKTVSTPTICEGKNAGKKNATTDEQQAIKDAHSKWEAKKKKGYVESVADAQEGLVNKEFVAGGFNPMLAEKFRDHGHKINYPWLGQPKLDGHRGTIDNGQLFSRTRKPITSCVHIMEALKEMDSMGIPLDGELYNHDYKDDFETLSSAIRKKDPLTPEMQKIVQYHVYDLNIDFMFHQRYSMLENFFRDKIFGTKYEEIFKLVPCEHIESKEQALARELHWRGGLGYEGYMLRNPNSQYAGKRTQDLQKVKIFQDAEFKVVGMEDGKGKMKGLAAKFICEIDDQHGKRTFKCTPKGTAEYKKQLFDNPSMWEGKMLTVEFLNYTRKNNVPRHGIGLRFRDMAY